MKQINSPNQNPIGDPACSGKLSKKWAESPPLSSENQRRKRTYPTPRARDFVNDNQVVSMIFGSLLGDGWGERRGKSTRLHLNVSTKNMEYLRAFHKFFYSRGLANDKKPLVNSTISKSSSVYYSSKVRTYSFSDWNWIHEAFYWGPSGKKRVPLFIESMLTERALATWYMDDGGLGGVGCKLSTDSFLREDVERLRIALLSRYGLNWTIQDHEENFVLYLPRAECPRFALLVRPFMVPSMHYKLEFRT